MARLHVGVTSSAYAGAGAYTPNPNHIETSWKNASALPSGWSLSNSSPAGTYSATDGTRVATGQTQFDATKAYSQTWKSLTVITSYKVKNTGTAGSAINSLLYLNNSTLTAPQVRMSKSTSDGGVETLAPSSFENGVSDPAPFFGPYAAKVAVNDIVVEASVYFADGSSKHYLLDANGFVGTHSEPAAVARTPQAVTSIDVDMAVFGAPEDSVYLQNTYWGFDEELTATQIKTKATSWGWATETAFSPGASANANTDWTTTSAPTSWTVNPTYPGTPTYTASGTYNADDETGNYLSWVKDVATPRYISSFTGIMDLNVTSQDTHDTYMSLGYAEVGGYSFVHRYFGSLVIEAFNNNDGTSLGSFTPASTTGHKYLAFTIGTSGAVNFYLLESGQTTQVITTATAKYWVDFPQIAEVSVWTFDSDYTLHGTPGNCRIAHTYIGLQEEKNQTQIETICSGWGWTP